METIESSEDFGDALAGEDSDEDETPETGMNRMLLGRFEEADDEASLTDGNGQSDERIDASTETMHRDEASWPGKANLDDELNEEQADMGRPVRDQTSIYTNEILTAVPNVMNEDGHKAMQRDIADKTKARNIKKHVRLDRFSQVKGKQTKLKSRNFHKKFYHYAGMTMPLDEDMNGKPTGRWPQFIPAVIYVDEVIDGPGDGGHWLHPNQAKAKERLIIGCYDEKLATKLKGCFARASAANFESTEDIDIQFAYSEEDLFHRAFRRSRERPVTQRFSSPSAQAVILNNFRTPSHNMAINLNLEG
jgi:hypothetical protein